MDVSCLSSSHFIFLLLKILFFLILALFWQSPKRCPEPLTFSLQDPLLVVITNGHCLAVLTNHFHHLATPS